jgi:LmbE family N-acetylglucosaminyl deacetylase
MSIPDLRSATRVLAVQPHYDDNDIAAGGTLAALRDRGAEIFYLTATDDLVGVLDQSLSDEEATARLRAEQHEAGAEIGVSEQYWAGFPDAGEWGYYDLRRIVIQHIRMLRPDFVFTTDPWLPYESHMDHLRTGRAVAEACMFFRFPRLHTTLSPNVRFDIGETRERKHRALDAYRSQFTPEGLEFLHRGLDFKEREFAEGEPFTHAEPLKVLRPGHLHCNLDLSVL